uniref:PiggyBac transposable element-derived protein domain-containing protein n=1 Tax=Oreochromis aureus TaxID=47969 RepID=A0AAZ1XVK0_OREAU
MDEKKKYSVQDALEFITAEDSEYEGCESSSDEDSEDPNYIPHKDVESDESSESSDSDSCGSSDLETEPHSSHMDTGQPKAAIKGQKFSWRKKTFETPETTFKGPCAKPPDEIHTPLEYFKNFITDDMLLLLIEQTNLYSVQKSNHLRNVNTTVKELEILIGLYLRMGLCQMPGNRAYWENDTRCPMVADNMSRNRFQTLLGSLHFTDNTDLLHRDAEDKYWKIRPWLEMFRKQCLDIVPEEYNSVDEQIVPFKGTHSPIRQYVKGKPHPWGLKIWARCSSSGMLHDFVFYQGGTGKKTLLGIGGDVVVKLCETLPAEQNYKVFADNFFSSAPLVLTLLQRQIYFVGTLRGNRLAGCQLEDEKSLAQRGRGSVDARATHCEEYNTFMGGIDLLDACIARYKYHMKSRRWYLYLFWQTIMLGVVNAWLIYCRDCKLLGVQKPLKQRTFQAEVATSLILWKSHRGVRVGVPEDVRTDEVAHWPVKCEKRGRCKNCKVNATTTLCEKYDVRLCFTEERNCFKSYHYQR